MRIAKWVWALAGILLVCSVAQAVAADAPSKDARHAYEYILVIAAAGGFGGFVHGMLRRTPAHYTIMWPFRAVGTDLGFLGDIFVGIAAGASIFFVMESIFGLNAKDLNNDQAYLKFVALGVICGYMGSSLLDGLAMVISKRLAKEELNLEKGQEELRKLRERAKAGSRAAQLLQLADGYRRWGMWDSALDVYDEAIAVEPDNADHYIQKSFVYADKAAQNHDTSLFDAAITLTNRALEIDKSSARAYYDRACYKHLMKLPNEEVLSNLKTAIGLNDVMRKMAKHDPDFKDLQTNEAFKKLVDTEAVHESKGETAAVKLRRAPR